MPVKIRKIVGLCSGTSADGIDAALVEIRSRRAQMKVRQLSWLHEPYSPQLRRRIAAACGEVDKSSIPLRGAAELDRDIGHAFAAAARKIIDSNGELGAEIVTIGSSGQRIALAEVQDERVGAEFSAGSAAVTASETNLPVVTGFTAGDLACGGNGSGVTAWPNWLLFGDRRLSRVVVELGGVAKLTFLPAGAPSADVAAYDVGPATVLLDQVAQKCCNCAMDTDGAIAAHAAVNHMLLNELLAGAYYQQAAPKAASPKLWDSTAIWRMMNMGSSHRCAGPDMLATVTEMIARSIANAIGALTERPHEVILCGGGAMNIHLAGRIRSLLSPCSTYAVEHYGISLRAHGAVCIAVLAAARLDGFAAHCHQAGGARRQTVLGSVTLP